MTARGYLRAAAAALLLACGMAGADEAARAVVTLQLKWHHQFQFAGYYAALEKGYYREAGLDVRLREASPETDPVAEVVAGRAQYGVGGSALVLARAGGKPVVALAAIFQHSPQILIARADSGIRTVHDLAGRRIMLEQHPEELIAYLRREGVPADSLHIVPHSFDTQDLLHGAVDAISAYSTDEPHFLGRVGIPHVSFSPRAAGIDFYGDNLFTTEDELALQPERTRAFVDASLRGWRYAMQHPDEIVDLILAKYSRHHDRDALLHEAREMHALLRPDLVELGYMYRGRWQHIVDIYADLGLMPRNFTLDGFLHDAERDEREARRQLTRIIVALVVAGGLLGTATVFVLHWQQRMKRQITAHRKTMAELRESEQKFRFIAENSADVIWTMDIASGRFTYVSPSVVHLRGYSPEEIMAQPVSAALTPESAALVQRVLADSLERWAAGDRSSTRRVTEVDQPHRDGRIIPTEVVTTIHGDAEGRPASILGVTRDISERRKSEELMRHMAFFDPLTQLPNRRLLLDRLQQSLALAGRTGGRLALVFIDLDNFKPINDSLGHQVGDWLLQAVAQRMLECVRASDTVARLGGDEFVVLLPGLADTADALAAAEKIRLALCTPFPLADGLPLCVSSSIGIAIHPDHGTTERDLIKHADEAMYQAKSAARNQVRLFAGTPRNTGETEADPHSVSLRLNWRTTYDSGSVEIDTEHRELFDQANALIDAAMKRDAAPEAFAGTFSALIASAAKHFAHEEAIIASLGYADVETHAADHRRLLARAADLERAAQHGGVSVGELVDFLAEEVVAGHLLKEDRKYYALFERQPAVDPR